MTDASEAVLDASSGSSRQSAAPLPWIISSDDHVIEPPHLWEKLPASYPRPLSFDLVEESA
jgi:hypothetical protein